MKVAVLVLGFSLCSTPVLAQVSGESEGGLDGKGESFFSQYVFYDWKKVNVLTRYFWVNGVLQRGEFALGPTINFGEKSGKCGCEGGGQIKLQFGGTTNKDVMVAGLIVGKVQRHEVLYIVDGKIATINNKLNTLYQKGFVALTKKGQWQLRVEHLQVGRSQSFLRIGGEYRHKLWEKTQLAFAPFYDPLRNSLGGQVDFRFF